MRQGDVTVAKNYMTHEEISTLNLIVIYVSGLCGAKGQGHIPMHMADWESKLGDFLRFNGREVLENFEAGVAEKLRWHQPKTVRAPLPSAERHDVDELRSV